MSSEQYYRGSKLWQHYFYWIGPWKEKEVGCQRHNLTENFEIIKLVRIAASLSGPHFEANGCLFYYYQVFIKSLSHSWESNQMKSDFRQRKLIVCRGKDHCRAGLQFNRIGFYQTRKIDVICRYELEIPNPNKSNIRRAVIWCFQWLFSASASQIFQLCVLLCPKERVELELSAFQPEFLTYLY